MTFPFRFLIFVGSLLLSMSTSLSAQSQLEWVEGDFKTVLAKAEKQEKELLVFACAEWSPSCNQLQMEALAAKEVGEACGAKYLAWRLDMSEYGAEEEVSGFRVSALPSFFILNPKGALIYHEEGLHDTPALCEFCDRGQEFVVRYPGLQERYTQGERDTSFLRKFIPAMYTSQISVRTPVLEFLNQLPDEAYRKEENFQFMYYGLFDLNSRPYQYLLAHCDYFRETFGEEMTDQIILGEYQAGMDSAIAHEDTLLFQEVQAVSRAVLGPEEAALVNLQEVQLFTEAIGDWERYVEASKQRFAQFPADTWEEYNQAAWNFYLHREDEEELKLALKWVNQSLRIERNYFNLDTRAGLLYKLDRWEEAKKAASMAIQVAKGAELDYSETQKLLKKMQ